jgi:hypothetical protein
MVTNRSVATEPDAGERSTDEELWPGVRLGSSISLSDFLARPVTRDRRGIELARDEQGKLCLMAPDDQFGHRIPLAGLHRVLRCLDDRFWTVQEPSVVFPRLIHLEGRPIPPSPLGQQTLEPDLAIFDGRPRLVPTPVKGRQGCLPDGLQVLVEVLSPSTYRNDLGLGRSDDVNRWASYLASGVPELWVLNAEVGRPCPLAPRSGLFLRNAGDRWEPLPVDDAAYAAGEVHGVRPVAGGRLRSLATGAEIDLATAWDVLIEPT